MYKNKWLSTSVSSLSQGIWLLFFAKTTIVEYKLQVNRLSLCTNDNLYLKRSLEIQISYATWLQLLNNSELKYIVFSKHLC